MKESKFIEQNKEKWIGFEQLLNSESRDPDRLSQFFIEITDDLSYARTFYNNRTIRVYLNNICQQLFYLIYKAPKKRTGAGGFFRFWREDLPLIAYAARRELLVSFCVFIIAVAIGVISSYHDPDFVRIILGDKYVDMTLENIASGDPMAVYKKANEVDMFMGITLNNLWVAFRTFVLGLFWAAGSVIILLYNGIMIGAFQYFFIEQGHFSESFLTIWLHGTLEISAIVIAGASGIVLGKGLITPGSYTRLQAFQQSARRGALLFLGITPIIVMAAVIESFLTRYTDTPDWIRLILIVFSLIFVLYYFGSYPKYLARRKGTRPEWQRELQASPDLTISYHGVIKPNTDILKDTFLFYRKHGRRIIQISLITALLYLPVIIWGILPTLPTLPGRSYVDWLFGTVSSFWPDQSHLILWVINVAYLTAFTVAILELFQQDVDSAYRNTWRSRLEQGFSVLVSYFVFMSPFLLNFAVGIVWCLLGAGMLTMMLTLLFRKEGPSLGMAFSRMRALLSGNYKHLLGLTLIVTIISGVVYLFLTSPLPLFYMDFLRWNMPVDFAFVEQVLLVMSAVSSLFFILMMLPLFMVGVAMSTFSFEEINEAGELRRQLNAFLKKI